MDEFGLVTSVCYVAESTWGWWE